MNGIFILYYFNHKLRKQTAKQTNTRVLVCEKQKMRRTKENETPGTHRSTHA
jgi:hypothetical protein